MKVGLIITFILAVIGFLVLLGGIFLEIWDYVHPVIEDFPAKIGITGFIVMAIFIILFGALFTSEY